jgi:hypothetical protein
MPLPAGTHCYKDWRSRLRSGRPCGLSDGLLRTARDVLGTYVVKDGSETWIYDSGLSSPMRTLIRNAVIAKLQPLTRAGGGWLEAVIPIGFSIKGPHDELCIDLLWQELGGRTPAIAVATTSLKPDDGGAPDTSRGHLTFELYLVSSHRCGLTDGRTAGDIAAATSNTPMSQGSCRLTRHD